MNITEAKRSMHVAFKSRKAIKLMGGPGIGKSELVEQYAHEQGEGYFFSTLNAATTNLAQVMGFMIPADMEGGGKKGVFTYPHYFLDERSNKPAFTFQRGMIRIEEWGQASGDVKRALATLVHERRVGEHKLPRDFDIAILSNRPEDRSGVGKEYDFLINRWLEAHLEPTVEPWVEWAITHGVSEVSIAFALQNIKTVFHGEVPEEQGPWCTPRSLVGADRFIQAAREEGWTVEDPLMTENLVGMIGKGAIAQYMAFLRLHHKLPKFEDIIARPDTTPVPDTPDALYLVTYALASRVDNVNVKPVLKYMRRPDVPKQFAIAFIKATLKRLPALINTREFGDWCRENASLVAAVQ